jgi:hypothetical protein
VQIATVKAALSDAVNAAAIVGLNCYPFVPDDPETPCFYPAEVILNPQTTFGGCDTADITCRVLVGGSEDLDSQQLLDQLLSRAGAQSIRTALDAARGAPGEAALDGAADDLSIVRIDGYRQVPGPDEKSYYGANITVRVLGS